MIKSAAIIKVDALPKWKEHRTEKKRLKKEAASERRGMKQYHPSPIHAEIDAEIDESAPTREELVAKADELGLEYRKNISYAKLLGLIEAELALETEV